MKIVIDIDEDIYNHIKNNYIVFNRMRTGKTFMVTIYNAIGTGTPLPKGHGRLGDLDIIRANVFTASMDSYFMPIKPLSCNDVTDIIDEAPTIIEADKEESEDK